MYLTILEYIKTHGYIMVFLFVFLQELEMPLIVPTEAILMFCGYLASVKLFNVYKLFFISLAADIGGTSLWYFIFFFFGGKIRSKYTKTFPRVFQKLDAVEKIVEKRGLWGIFVLRLTPFIRGHASLISGLLGVPYKKLAPIILAASFVWTGSLLGTGFVLGADWRKILPKVIGVSHLVVWVALIIISVLILRFILKREVQGEQKIDN